MAEEMKRYLTPTFRASFVHLLQPNKKWLLDANPKTRYEVSAVWDPSTFTPQEKQLWADIVADLTERCKQKFKISVASGKLDDLIREMRDRGKKFALHFGKEKEGTEPYGPGKYFANLSGEVKPEVASTSRDTSKPIDPKTGKHPLRLLTSADDVYSGMWARARVNMYDYTRDGGGVMLGILNAQKVGDGEKLAGGRSAADDFDDDLDERWAADDGDDAMD